MDEELLKQINEKLHTEFDKWSCHNSPEVLREILEMNRPTLLADCKWFKKNAWTEENMDFLVDILKKMSEEEIKRFDLNWTHEGLNNSYTFMKKCLDNDFNINYSFISDDTLIDDDILEKFIKGKKKIPHYKNGFFYKLENLERIKKLGEEYYWEYIYKFDSSLWNPEFIENIKELIENNDNLNNYWEHILKFPTKAWTPEMIEIIINFLKNNTNIEINRRTNSTLMKSKIFWRRCLEEDLTNIDYAFFSNQNIMDDDILELMITKRKQITRYMGGFFFKQENIARILKFKEGYRLFTDFSDSMWTEENVEMLIQYAYDNDIENKDQPGAAFWFRIFPKKLSKNPKLLKACISRGSITTLREFDEKEIWTEEDKTTVIEYIRGFYTKSENEGKDLEWQYFPDFFLKDPEMLKVALETDPKAVWRYRSFVKAKEAWTDENKEIYNKQLEKKKSIFEEFKGKYGLNIKLSEKQIYLFFGEDKINTNGIRYLFENGYANIINKMIDDREISGEIFNENELTTLNYCRELNQEDSIQREFSKMFCMYINKRKENSDADKIQEIFGKIKDAISACTHLDMERKKDVNILNVYMKYLEENMESIETSKINLSFDIIRRIEYSNSSELAAFTEQIANDVLKTEQPIETLAEIEDIFLKNHLPAVGKIWEVFIKLHPDLVGFNFSKNSSVSPTLKNTESVTKRKSIIFADLIRIAIGSNNRSLNNYFEFIERGGQIVEKVIEQNQMPAAGSDESKLLMQFVDNLVVLYKSSLKNKIKESDIKKDDDAIEKIKKLKRLFTPANNNQQLRLEDSIVRMFCHYAGFDSLQEIREYQQKKLKEREEVHIASSKQPFTLRKGDFIKGIGDIKYLANILENGSVAKEFLGDSATSDGTPLDTDCSIIEQDGLSIKDAMTKTIARTYGPIWIVLKGDDRFNITRDSSKNVLTNENSKDKMETFSTGSNGHYGIRTGFASSETDCFIADSHYDRIALELAIKGMYIPVRDKEGTLKFSYEQYVDLRKKMQGLSYYGSHEYEFAQELDFEGIQEIENSLEQSNAEVRKKKEILYQAFKEEFPEYELTDSMSSDLTLGKIEILDTGSTGRGTNVIGDGDFDFIVRIDKEILLDPEKYERLRKRFANALGQNSAPDKFRFEEINMSGLEQTIDVDMTFIGRTNKLDYSTEMCVRDRLETIKQQDENKYKKVVANIIFAKKFMKEHECYKPWHAGKKPQGGLGGVGIENWILQNGGSFVQAAKNFLACAKGRTLEEFKKEYMIWDFGSNHMSTNKISSYPHDNFVYNMNQSGFNKMIEALQIYLDKRKKEQDPR